MSKLDCNGLNESVERYLREEVYPDQDIKIPSVPKDQRVTFQRGSSLGSLETVVVLMTAAGVFTITQILNWISTVG